MTICSNITRYCCVYLLAFSVSVSASKAQQQVMVIELKHQTADAIIDTIKPFVSTSGHITGTDTQLIVRTTPSNLHELLNIVDAIDKPEEQLLITLRQGLTPHELVHHYGIRDPILSSALSASSKARRYYATAAKRSTPMQVLRITSGYPAFIDMMHSAPLIANVTHWNNADWDTDETTNVVFDQQETVNGFYVLAMVVNEQVLLEMIPYNRINKSPILPWSELRTERAHTQLRVPFGQWQIIGGHAHGEPRAPGTKSYTSDTINENDRFTIIKVERQTKK